MKKIVKYVHGCKKYCGSNVLAGTLNTYNYIIKCDIQSSVLNVYINIQQQKNDKDTIKEIKNKLKNTSININNNRIVISAPLEERKYLPDTVNPILEITTEVLKKNKYKEICKNCKKEIETILIDNDGEINYFCEECYNSLINDAKSLKEQSLKAKEHVILGTCGSILCTIPGVLLWFFFSYLNIEPAIAAIVITMGSALGYKYFAKNMKLKGLFISIAVGLFIILLTHEINCSIYIYNLHKKTFNINLFDAYKAIPYYLKTNMEFKKTFIKELSTGFILSIIGIFSSFSLYRQSIYTYDIKKIGE